MSYRAERPNPSYIEFTLQGLDNLISKVGFRWDLSPHTYSPCVHNASALTTEPRIPLMESVLILSYKLLTDKIDGKGKLNGPVLS